MSTLTIRHQTLYRYSRPVGFGPHRLMLRPRESHDLRLLSSSLTITPAAKVTWAQDVFGNAVAVAVFPALAEQLVVDSMISVQLDVAAWPIFDIAAGAVSYPFRYADDEWTDLGALTIPQHSDPAGTLSAWVRGFVRSAPTDTLSLLRDLSAGVSASLEYDARDEEGTQSPVATLRRRRGSCRDFAVLFVEATRCLGLGARIVSGYLIDPGDPLAPVQGAGSTHAWGEVYLPGAGWITFDPTNRSMGGFNLIPVAVARHIGQAVPVAGSFVGPSDAFLGMSVSVVCAPVPPSD